MYTVTVLGVNYIVMEDSDLHSSVHKIGQDIQRTGKKYATIVALMSGGAAYARYLRDKVHTPLYRTIGIDFYRKVRDLQSKDITKAKPNIYQPLSSAESIMEPILVVDDISDTGETPKTAIEHLNENGFHDIDTATWVVKNKTSHWPNFYAVVVDAEDWVVFSWERREFIADRLPEWRKSLSLEQIKDITTKEMKFDPRVFEDALMQSQTSEEVKGQ
jgi:hypoxanthine phosphoribosyltransferase